jgi:hypothetical protein
MTTDSISTAKQSDVAYQNDSAGSLIRLKTQQISDVSSNAGASGSTESMLESQIHLVSSAREENSKAFILQHPSEYENVVKALGGLRLRKLLGPNSQFRATRNVSSRPHVEERFHLLQKFQGQVTEIFDHEFRASLNDLSGDYKASESAIFAMDEIDNSDRKLLREGAIFYWYIGYSSGIRGRRRQSFISFSRSGRMTLEQFASSYHDLDEMWSILSAELPPEGQ